MSEPGYYRYPTIYGDTVVFTCEDDLWTVPLSGGIARRLTAGHGECSMPRFSPDGTMIAFVGRDEGHPEVFVIPSTGGAARRLTYMGGLTCNISGWSADGRQILFSSEAQSPFFRHTEAFAVSAEGGLPEPLNLGHVQSIAYGPKNSCVIGRNNNDPARWKRYRGGTAGEIWVDADGKGLFTKLTSVAGNMVLPMWIGRRVFFLSDHDGVGNLYSCESDGSDLRQHTHHEDYFVRFPSTDGNRIVYSAGADIYLWDPKNNESRHIDIVSPSGNSQSARRFVEVNHYLEHFAPHPEGHSLALVGRGQPITMGNWEGAVIQHGSGSRVRYRGAEWLADGQRFVVISDANGQERLEVHRADQSEAPLKIDGSFGRVIEMRTSPASDMVALTNHRQELIVVDLKTKKVQNLDRSPADRITGINWSGDGQWIAYSFAPRPNMAVIKVANVRTREVQEVTDEVKFDYSPAFDPEGKYLYFLSARDYYPVYDTLQFDLGFPSSVRPFVITLRKDVPSPFIQNPRPLTAKGARGETKSEPADPANAKDDGKNTTSAAVQSAARTSKGKKELASDKKNKRGNKSGSNGSSSSADDGTNNKSGKSRTAVSIDFDGIKSRILGFPVPEGQYIQLAAGKNRIFFTQFPVRGIRPGFNWHEEGTEVGNLMAFSFEDNRAATIQKEVGFIRLANDAQTIAYRSKYRLRVADVSGPLPAEGAEPPMPAGTGRKSGWIDMHRAQVLVQPHQEWTQMYEEAWRLQKEQFWDEGMSSVDWDVVYKRYEVLLKRVRTRSELSDIIWEMHGELGTSHAYEMGGDYRRLPAYYRGFLGAEFAWDKGKSGYRVKKILRGESWNEGNDSPLAVPGVNIDEGDLIIAVNGRGVTKDCTIDELLINNAARDVSLTVLKPSGKRESAVAKTLRSEAALRYRAWVQANRDYVHKKTGGRVGYVHIPDMGPIGFAEFHRGYLSEFHRDGLIVDARYNRGGHVSPLLLEKLARKRVGYDVSRWGMPQPYPPESVAGPMVCLTNQFAGSDGDIFSHCFKLYKLGPLVGKRTWGGVIGIWPRHRLVDGTITTQPEFSFWFKDVGWKVENYGTDPDYDVDIAPQDYKANRDPQMDRGLELILRELKQNPVELPDFAKRPSLALPGNPLSSKSTSHSNGAEKAGKDGKSTGPKGRGSEKSQKKLLKSAQINSKNRQDSSKKLR